jgi:magnesium-transporting ATPase (P-type)
MLWKDISVGVLLYIRAEENIPADCLLLCSGNDDGSAFVETANIDGETNLKPKISPIVTQTQLTFVDASDSDEALPKLRGDLSQSLVGYVASEPPNANVHTFEGQLNLKSQPSPIPLSAEQLLLRGSKLKNTPWALMMVLYTGDDTKVIRNSGVPPLKNSHVERKNNLFVKFVFATQMLVCFIVATVGAATNCSAAGLENAWYIRPILAAGVGKKTEETQFGCGSTGAQIGSWFVSFFTNILLFQDILPISIYVSLDVVKTIQARMIQWDRAMYYAPADKPAVSKTSTLNEELGQIEYVFSDKTGTLTCNQMKFRCMSCFGRVFGKVSLSAVEEPPVNLSRVPKNLHQHVNKFVFCIMFYCHRYFVTFLTGTALSTPPPRTRLLRVQTLRRSETKWIFSSALQLPLLFVTTWALKPRLMLMAA